MPTISVSATPSFVYRTNSRLSLKSLYPLIHRNCDDIAAKPYSSSFLFHPLRVAVVDRKRVMLRQQRGCGAVCYSAPLTTQ
ncbi:unnamed protein product [Rhodiola kirilowii]